MKKAIGIAVLLVVICVGTSLKEPTFLNAYNVQNIINWTSLFSILSIGAAFVIIAGGIDLSIGAVVGLAGCLLSLLLNGWHIRIATFDVDVTIRLGVVPALLVVLATSVLIGLFHGLLITKLRLQPFVVTLCGLLLYRGIARWITGDATQGFGDTQFEGLRSLAVGKIPLAILGDFELPVPLFIVLGLALLAGCFLHWTIYGRYLLALGRNEQAARYSGINTDRMTIVAYVICSVMAGLGGVLLALEVNSLQPSGFGNFYELYAIAAAVLGGCSLRGGEGSILGVIIGTALIRVLYNATNILGIPTYLEFATIGAVILLGVVSDEIMRRISAQRRTRSL